MGGITGRVMVAVILLQGSLVPVKSYSSFALLLQKEVKESSIHTCIVWNVWGAKEQQVEEGGRIGTKCLYLHYLQDTCYEGTLADFIILLTSTTGNK